jgi:hypothetical protein
MKAKVLVTLSVLCIVASAAMFLHGTKALNRASQYGLAGYGLGLGGFGGGYGGPADYGMPYGMPLGGGYRTPNSDIRKVGGGAVGGGFGDLGSPFPYGLYGGRSTQRPKTALAESRPAPPSSINTTEKSCGGYPTSLRVPIIAPPII